MNPRILFFVIFAVGVLGGMFFVFKPSQTPKQSVDISSAPNESISPTSSTEKTFELTVKEGKLVSGPKALSVNEGDSVTIVITADEAEELHVHGYDVSVDLEVNKPAKLTFVADQSGHFPYELEHAKVEIGAVEVQPK